MALAAVPYLDALPVANRKTAGKGRMKLSGVSKTYAAADGQKTVLSGIDLEIEPGEFVVVLGQTGCGKSTLLRLMLGEEAPTTGEVEVSGKRVQEIDSSSGYVPQKYSLFPNRTALENVMFGPLISRYRFGAHFQPGYYGYRRRLKSEALEQLARMGLRPADAAKYPHKLSGGMQQRVAIAQALMMRPSVLLMDEAFSALDPSTRISLQQLLADVWREQRPTIVFVTHNVPEALCLGTRLVVLGQHGGEAEMKSNKIADFELPQSEAPYLERRHTREFMELLCRVEELSYGMKQYDREASPGKMKKN